MGFPQHRHCRILLVDDDPDTRYVLTRLLSRHFQVATAECYDSALASADDCTPDIVITDIGLPSRDGIALMRELRARHGVSGIAVTGHVIDDMSMLRDAGFLNVLLKPIQFGDLLDAVTAAQVEPCADAA